MKIKNKILAMLLTGAMMISAVGCTATKDNASGAVGDAPTIRLLSMSSNEKDANVVRDQLSKAGFDVELNIQPDYSSFVAQQDAGNYDLSVTGWTTVTGNPDYAVRSLFKTDGDYNKGPIADSKIDELIEKAATETPDQYVDTYKELELRLVDEKAYIAPLYSNIKTQGINAERVKDVRLSKSRSLAWEDIDFVDESKRDTESLILSQTMSDLTSLDPIKGNDGSINMLNTNMYVRLVNLTDDDEVTSEGSLSYNYAIAEGNSEYYFILRDDINFAKVENDKSIDTGELVGAEDVVFSLERAMDKNAVPDHRTYSLHENMEKVEIVTDLAELDKSVSGDDTTIRETLEQGISSPISSLENSKDNVNNTSGNYQVVKVTTKTPFPQVLNYLAHQSAGIVSKNQIEAVNTYDVDTYDRSADVAYGDQSTVTKGATYDNTLAASGPYIMIYKDDYEAVFEKNPAYMPGTEHEPKIQTVVMKFISDQDSALSALRSGEIDVQYSVPVDKLDLVENDEKLELQAIPSNAVTYVNFNLDEDAVTHDENVRRAALYAINQEEFIAVYDGNVFKAYSTLSPLVDTGNEHIADMDKVQELLSNE